MSGPGEWEPWDWYAMCRKLMHGESHYRPWEIPHLTDAELLAALDDDVSERRPPTGSIEFQTHDEMVAHVERIRSMTIEERLQAAMED